jgi:hypothetical protein
MGFADMKTSLLFAFAALLPACAGQALDVGSDGQAGSSMSGSNAAGSNTDASNTGGSNTDNSNTGGLNTGGSNLGGSTASGSAGTSGSTAGTAPAEDLPPVVSPWPDSACEAGAGNPFEGTWSGYAQGQGHSDDFTLVLGGSSEAPCGTITFGEPVSYAPATDPEVPYPPVDSAAFKPTPRSPGFTYTLLAAEVDGTRLQFRIAYAEAYGSWCGLQTSYPRPQGGFACLPSYGDGVSVEGDSCHATGSSAQGHVYACTHYFACLGFVDPLCACQAGGCIANIDGEGERFDLAFEETDASGLMSTKTVLLEKE